MIAFVVGRGMGHLGRCISIMNRLSKKALRLQVHAYSETHNYLKGNLEKDCTIQSYQTGKIGGAKEANVLIHDWRPEVAFLRQKRALPKMTKTVSLYHSEFLPHSLDKKDMRKFKKHIRQVAEKTDVFLHMNVIQPARVTKKMKCLYIPVPLITRDASCSAEQVKGRLGLNENESFILVQMGSGLGKHRYRDIPMWYKEVDRLADRYRFVIAGQLADEPFPFKNKVIQAPLFPNGKDLVQAADLVVSKPGMGILGDCISTRTPLLMLPGDNPERKQKVRLLRKIIQSNIGIVKKPMELEKKIEKALKKKHRFKECFEKIPANGADVAASILLKLQQIPRKDLRKRKKELYRLTPFYSTMEKRKNS